MNALISTALWVVGKALAPVTDGVLGDWDSSKNLGLNVEALGTELLLVKATLETASRKHIGGQAMKELLWKLRESASCAEDLLDELDYFRIHDELHGTYDAADHHAKGGVHDLALNARHTSRAVLGLSSAAAPAEPGQVLEGARQRGVCCGWPRARQRSRGSSSSTSNANQADEEKVFVRLCQDQNLASPILHLNLVLVIHWDLVAYLASLADMINKSLWHKYGINEALGSFY